MITFYNCILFLHIVGAVMWIGSVTTFELLQLYILKIRTRESIERFVSMGNWFAPHVIAPASITTILSGILLVAIGGAHFRELWIILALLGIVIAVLLGAGFIGRTVTEVSLLLKDPNAPLDQIEKKLLKAKIVSYIDLYILFFILFDMVMRPEVGDTGFFLVTGGIFLVVVAYAFSLSRKRERPV